MDFEIQQETEALIRDFHLDSHLNYDVMLILDDLNAGLARLNLMLLGNGLDEENSQLLINNFLQVLTGQKGFDN